MPIPAVLAGLALASAITAGASYLIGKAGEEYERSRIENKKAQEFLSQSQPVGYSSPSGEVQITTENPYAQALQYAQAKEQQRLESTPEIPGVSDITKAIGAGKTTTGLLGQSTGIGKILPEKIKELDIDTSVVGGGYTERQTRDIKEYLEKKGLPQEKVSEASYYLGQVGRYQAPFQVGQTLVAEVGGNIAGRTASTLVSGTKTIQKIANPTIRQAVASGLGASGGAIAESAGQSVSQLQQTGQLTPTNFLTSTASGALVGSAFSFPIGAGIAGGATAKSLAKTATKRTIASAVEKTSDIAGQLIDAPAETLGDLATIAGQRTRSRFKIFSVGITPITTTQTTTQAPAQQKTSTAFTPTQTTTQTTTRAPTQTNKPFTFVNPTPQKTPTRPTTITPTPTQTTTPTITDQLIPTQEPNKPTQTPTQQKTSVPVNVFASTPTRTILPNRPFNFGTGLLFPALGMSLGATARARKRYINELQGLRFLNFGMQKKLYNRTTKVMFSLPKPSKNKRKRSLFMI